MLISAPRPTANAHVHLPVELLRLIFCHVVDGKMPFFLPCHVTTGTDDDSESQAGDPRMQLAHICSHWRAVALGTPQLWDNIVINLNWRPSQVLSIAAGILSWNADLPRALTVRRRFELRAPPRPSADEFVEKIMLPFAHSFRRLDLLAPSRFITALLSPRRAIRFPILEKLSICPASDRILVMSNLVGPSETSSSELRFPRLTAVETGLHLKRTDIAGVFLNTVQVSQLTAITFKNLLSVAVCCHILSILSSCTSLRSCSIHLEAVSYVDARLGSVPQIVMPHLERLHIRFSSPKAFREFFSRFTLPSIRDLALKDTVNGLGLTRAISNVLVEQCGPSLEHLFIASAPHRDFEFSFEGFDRVLQKYKTTLKRLYIPLTRTVAGQPRLPGRLVLQLVLRELCPNLESLAVGFVDYSGEEIGLIKDALIEADLGGRKPIKELHLSTQPGPAGDESHSTEIKRTCEGLFEIFVCHHYDQDFDGTYITFDPEALEKKWFGTRG